MFRLNHFGYLLITMTLLINTAICQPDPDCEVLNFRKYADKSCRYQIEKSEEEVNYVSKWNSLINSGLCEKLDANYDDLAKLRVDCLSADTVKFQYFYFSSKDEDFDDQNCINENDQSLSKFQNKLTFTAKNSECTELTQGVYYRIQIDGRPSEKSQRREMQTTQYVTTNDPRSGFYTSYPAYAQTVAQPTTIYNTNPYYTTAPQYQYYPQPVSTIPSYSGINSLDDLFRASQTTAANSGADLSAATLDFNGIYANTNNYLDAIQNQFTPAQYNSLKAQLQVAQTNRVPPFPSSPLNNADQIYANYVQVLQGDSGTGVRRVQGNLLNSEYGGIESKSSSLSTGAIVGIVAGGVVVLILIGVAIYFCKRSSKYQGQRPETEVAAMDPQSIPNFNNDDDIEVINDQTYATVVQNYTSNNQLKH